MAASPTLTDVPVDRSTAKELQRIANKIEKLLEERDQLVIKARAEGASLREIGELLSINHVTVKNLIERVSTEHIKPNWIIEDTDVRF